MSRFSPAAAILLSAGFFFSVLSPETIRVGSSIILTYLGAVVLGISVLLMGIGLLRGSHT